MRRFDPYKDERDAKAIQYSMDRKRAAAQMRERTATGAAHRPGVLAKKSATLRQKTHKPTMPALPWKKGVEP